MTTADDPRHRADRRRRRYQVGWTLALLATIGVALVGVAYALLLVGMTISLWRSHRSVFPVR